MEQRESLTGWIHKLQELPEKKRKVILWGVLIVVGLVMIAWFVNNVRETLILHGQ